MLERNSAQCVFECSWCFSLQDEPLAGRSLVVFLFVKAVSPSSACIFVCNRGWRSDQSADMPTFLNLQPGMKDDCEPQFWGVGGLGGGANQSDGD